MDLLRSPKRPFRGKPMLFSFYGIIEALTIVNKSVVGWLVAVKTVSIFGMTLRGSLPLNNISETQIINF